MTRPTLEGQPEPGRRASRDIDIGDVCAAAVRITGSRTVIEPERIDVVQRVVADVGITVPGLRVGGVDGGQPSGIGHQPASL